MLRLHQGLEICVEGGDRHHSAAGRRVRKDREKTTLGGPGYQRVVDFRPSVTIRLQPRHATVDELGQALKPRHMLSIIQGVHKQAQYAPSRGIKVESIGDGVDTLYLSVVPMMCARVCRGAGDGSCMPE